MCPSDSAEVMLSKEAIVGFRLDINSNGWYVFAELGKICGFFMREL